MKNVGLIRKSVFLLAVLFCFALSTHASVYDKLTTIPVKYQTIHYISVDANNKPIVLSAMISYPLKEKNGPIDTIRYVTINNHATLTKDAQCPTGSSPMDAVAMLAPNGIMNMSAALGTLVVSCDYIGYGDTKSSVHPYLNPTLTARNVMDGFEAAIDTVKALGGVFADDYYTVNVGYSQGGQVSMCVQRYLETEASQALRDKVRLRKSYCGAGAYDLSYVFNDLCSQPSLSYPCSLPLTLEGLEEAYKEGCMRCVDLDDIYINKEFRDYACHLLNAKTNTTTAINDSLHAYFGKDSILLADMFKKDLLLGDGPQARAIKKALQKCNLLDGKWMPETPMALFHYSGDEIVEPGNSTEAVALFGDRVTFYDETSGLTDQLSTAEPTIAVLLKMMKSNPKNHTDYAIYFYAYFLAGLM